MKKAIQNLLRQKDEAIPHLESWFETFNPYNVTYSRNDSYEDEFAKMDAVHDSLLELLERFKSDTCSDEDLETLVFHIEECINCEDEVIIKLYDEY